MLREFRTNSSRCLLAQADGGQLLFRNGRLEVVLLMQILSVVGGWRNMLDEAMRVLRPGGNVAVGHIVSQESGIGMQLKRQLRAILEEMQVAWHRPQETRRQALDWLESSAIRHIHLQAASWNSNITAEAFLQRQRTGARFAALPVIV